MSAMMTAEYADVRRGKGLPRERVERILEDLRYEPPWRAEAARELDYYDGNQLDQKTLARMEELGMPPIIVNLIAPTINAVIGLEARTRSDPLVRGEAEQHVDAAEALNEKLKEATRLARLNRATSDAFGYQSKIGIGWVEVSKSSDPFQYPYRVKQVSHKEMWWDWRAREPDLSDARFVVRRRWYDADELAGHFPKHKAVINQAISMRPAWEGLDDNPSWGLARSWDIEQSTSLQDEEWRDTERHRLALYEVWYKVFEDVWVLDLPDGRVVEFDRSDDMQVQAVAAGIVRVRKARTHRVRVAYYLGPHQLADEATPYRHNRFPYVPFFGYREDRSGAPYGLIRPMKSPQEEVNARRTKMLHILSSRRVTADADAVEDHKAAADEVARSDAYIILNENRRNADGFKVGSDEGLNRQQYELMIEAKGNVQEASGLFQEFMGRAQGTGQSGEAIKNLIEQGQQVLGEIMDNYREARRQSAELLLSMIVEDLGKQDDVQVAFEKATGEKKNVLLNHPEVDELGNEYRSNDVTKLRMQVALDETPSSLTYRQQTLQRMMEITEALPEDLQRAVIDMVVSQSDLPNRNEMVERIRAVTGVGGGQADPDDPEAANRQAMEQQQAEMAQQMEMQSAQLELAKQQAEIAEREAKVAKMEAEQILTRAKAQKLAGADTQLTEAEIQHKYAKMTQEEREQARRAITEAANLTERAARLEQEQLQSEQPQLAAQQQDSSAPRHGAPPGY